MYHYGSKSAGVINYALLAVLLLINNHVVKISAKNSVLNDNDIKPRLFMVSSGIFNSHAKTVLVAIHLKTLLKSNITF